MDPMAAVAEQFVSAAAEDFPTSPLYQALKPIVAPGNRRFWSC
jgi:hypothetical protein